MYSVSLFRNGYSVIDSSSLNNSSSMHLVSMPLSVETYPKRKIVFTVLQISNRYKLCALLQLELRTNLIISSNSHSHAINLRRTLV